MRRVLWMPIWVFWKVPDSQNFFIGIEVGPFNYSRREQTIFKIVVRFNIKRGILFCVICVLSCQLVLIQRGTWENDFSLFWKENSFLYHRRCCADSKPRSWWSFFRELPLIAPAIASPPLHWINSSLYEKNY